MSSFSGHTPRIKKLKGDVTPSQFSWTTTPSPCSRERGERAVRRTRKRLLPDCDTEQEGSIVFLECQDIDLTTGNFEEVAMHEESVYVNQQVQATVESSTKDTQTDNAHYPAPEIVVVVKVNATTIDAFVNDPVGMQFYTGLDSVDVFTGVLASLGPAAHKLKYLYAAPTLDVRNQLLLTLIKLRLYITNFQLGRMFEVTQLEVYNIFVTWVKFMSKQWRKINIWPERDTVRHFAPTDFKTKFPTTRAIFDGTECPVKKPAAAAAQQATFSTYKNRNTAKVLVGVAPAGHVSYVSPAYGGSASDRQIVERSNLTQMVDQGDSVMADKGFDVQDMFAPMNVTVNIPTFFRKKNKMSGETVIRDRKISSKRVHVERIIGLAKTYKILKNPMNHTESLLASEIIFVCFMLTNFRKSIVPKNA